VKEFLSHSDLEFTERDVALDEEAMAELEQLGVFTTPVVVIDGQVVVGFDRPKLERLLELADE
jgi:glutaredoxin